MIKPSRKGPKPARTYRKTHAPVHLVMHRRGNLCLFAAGVVGAFLMLFMLGAGGQWSSWQTWLTLTVAALAALALACYIAATLRAPRKTVPAQLTGDSPVSHPGVSHLNPEPVLTPAGQEK